MPGLSALSVGELVTILRSDILTRDYNPDPVCERFTIGVMSVGAALARFHRQKNKAASTAGAEQITSLPPLETCTPALILTGNNPPSPLIIQQSEALGVPVLLVKEDTWRR